MINLTDRDRELIEQICYKNKRGSASKANQSTSENSDSKSKLVSNSSTKILVSKLERKLNETLNEVDDQKIGQITYQQLGRIFTLLEIFTALSYNQDYQIELIGYNNPLQKQTEMELHEKAWNILSNGSESIDIQAAFCFFRIILDPNYLEPSKSALLIKEYLEKIKEVDFNQDSIIEFCKEFQLFQKSRLSNAKIGYLKPQLAQNLIESYEKTLTFKPELNPISEALQQQQQYSRFLKEEDEQLVNQYLSQSHSQSIDIGENNRVDELYRKQELTNQKIEYLKQEQQMKNMQECTFKPKVRSTKQLPNVVDRLYKVKNSKQIEERARQAEIERENQEYSQCSFHPNIKYYAPDQPYSDIRGFDRNVQRIRSAIDQRHLKDLKLNHKPIGEKYEKMKSMPFIPPDMLSRSQQKKELPILYIDVKLGPSKVGRLAIRENDDLEKVVQSFAKVWGVNQTDYDLLLTQVQQNMEKINCGMDYE